jgi:hypothetical protein
MQVRYQRHWTGHIEAELIAPQQGFVTAVLADFVGDGVQHVVAEIFEHAAMPVEQRAVAAGFGRTVGAQAQIAGLRFELVNGAVHVGVGRRRRRLLFRADHCRGTQPHCQRVSAERHTFQCNKC